MAPVAPAPPLQGADRPGAKRHGDHRAYGQLARHPLVLSNAQPGSSDSKRRPCVFPARHLQGGRAAIHSRAISTSSSSAPTTPASGAPPSTSTPRSRGTASVGRWPSCSCDVLRGQSWWRCLSRSEARAQAPQPGTRPRSRLRSLHHSLQWARKAIHLAMISYGGAGNRTRVRKCSTRASTSLSGVRFRGSTRPPEGSATRYPVFGFAGDPTVMAAS